MKAIIDSILAPVLKWLIEIKMYIKQMSVPVARPIEPSYYLGPFAHFGPYWTSFVSTAFALGFIYLICYIVVNSQGLYGKFKESVKWW